MALLRSKTLVARLVLLATAVAGCSLSAEELQYVRVSGSALPAVVAGDGSRIYVAAQTGGSGDIKTQTRRAIGNVKTALAAANATLADLVRLDIYLLKTEQPETVRAILRQRLPKAAAPNQSILPVPELRPAGSLIQISAMAVSRSEPGRVGVTFLNPKTSPEPGPSAMVSIARSRGLIYLSGQSDNAIGKHDPITDMAELIRRSMAGLEIALKAGRASFGDVANVVVYVSSLRQFDRLQETYRSYFPDGKVPPTSYIPRADSDGAEPWVEIDAEAAVPPDIVLPSHTEFLSPEGLVASRFYSYVVRPAPGRTVYISAQVSTESRDSLAQAQAIYDRIQDLLKAAGASFRDLVKIRVFLTPSGGTYQAINNVRTKLYDPAATPTSTLLAWDGLADPGARFQIDAVAVIPSR